MKTFITPHATHSLLKFIEEHQDKKLIFEVRPYKKPRSLGLNAYHWAAVITPLAAFCGESPERIHEVLCGEYFGWETKCLKGGFQIRKPRRTTTTNEEGKRDVLNWEQMTNFVYFCKAKAADIGCPLSDNEAAA